MAINQKNIKPGQQDDFLRIQDLLYNQRPADTAQSAPVSTPDKDPAKK